MSNSWHQPLWFMVLLGPRMFPHFPSAKLCLKWCNSSLKFPETVKKLCSVVGIGNSKQFKIYQISQDAVVDFTSTEVDCLCHWPDLAGHQIKPYRRKFRSEISDNMDSWKAEVRRVRREEIRRKKIQVREKVGTSRFTVFFQWFVAPEGRKVGSLKRRVRSQLARWEMKNCTPLWREAHFQVKMYKTHTDRLRCRKRPLLEVEMSKKCTPLWREAHFQVKSVKNWRSRTTFGGSDVEKVSKKCTPLWREAHFEVKSLKNWGFWAFFDVKMSKK